jgi:cephalosporin-C deacetylase-like acetyl esterase
MDVLQLRAREYLVSPAGSQTNDDSKEQDSSERDDSLAGPMKRKKVDDEDAYHYEDVFQRIVRLFSDSAELGHADAQTVGILLISYHLNYDDFCCMQALGQLFELAGDYSMAVKW